MSHRLDSMPPETGGVRTLASKSWLDVRMQRA